MSVDLAERVELAEASDTYDDDGISEDAHEVDPMPTDGDHDVESSESSDIK